MSQLFSISLNPAFQSNYMEDLIKIFRDEPLNHLLNYDQTIGNKFDVNRDNELCEILEEFED